jgi:hypothetical protein
MLSRITLTLTLLAVAQIGAAQTAPKPDPDTLLLTNGEKLIGKFVRSTGATVTFHSDSLGDVKVDWSKIQELHSSQKFAVVKKGVELNRHSDLNTVPQGTVDMAAQTLSVGGQKVAVGDAADVIDQTGFQNAVLHSPGFFDAWKGSVTAGVAIVQATQQSRSFSGGISLIRAVPTEDWLSARNRTTFNMAGSDGSVTQPGSPTLKTEIFHADAERDEYISKSNAYFFVQTAFDHNFSQGLTLQQMYGAGFGWTLVKQANETLDLKGSMSYERQSFQVAASDHNLIGSVFSESFMRKLGKGGITFLEGISFTPAWNEMHAYSWNANASLNVPVLKRLGFTAAALDTFLNDPPPAFKRNSFQLTMGLTYTLK